MMLEIKRRSIKSFVKREGRLTPGQQRALDDLWPKFGLELSATAFDFAEIFGNSNPVIVEIGFGNGASLLEMAQQNPEQNYLGIEVHRPGVGSLLAGIEKENITNLRVICHDAVEVLKQSIRDNSVDGFQIFFPDPWHKKRHNKRRLIQPELVNRLIAKLKPSGFIHCATDWENYAEQMLEVLSAMPELKNQAGLNQFTPSPAGRPKTKFEQRGERLGHGVWDLIFIKQT